jgi:hypothetical protein
MHRNVVDRTLKKNAGNRAQNKHVANRTKNNHVPNRTDQRHVINRTQKEHIVTQNKTCSKIGSTPQTSCKLDQILAHETNRAHEELEVNISQ